MEAAEADATAVLSSAVAVGLKLDAREVAPEGRAAPGGYCQQRLAHSNRAICVHMHNRIVNEHTHTRFEVVTSRIFLSINSPSLAVYKK